ncbi:MAG TPA: POTRA domain-containing protein [Bacteroidales bacterium]
MTVKRLLILLLLALVWIPIKAQINLGNDLMEIDYSAPRTYTIGGITVTGVQYLDNDVLIMLSELKVADQIQVPGEKITKAIQKLWEQGLFDNIRITASKIDGDLIFLNIDLVERPRMSKFLFTGIKKSEADALKEKVKMIAGDVVTDNMIIRTRNIIQKHYTSKGFLNAKIDIKQVKDTTKSNNVILIIDIDKNRRVRIEKINFVGNKMVSAKALAGSMKKTKEMGVIRPFTALDKTVGLAIKSLMHFDFKNLPENVITNFNNNLKFRIFKSSKFIEEDYTEDKLNMIKKFNEQGFRDAILLKDSVYHTGPNKISIDLKVSEGHKYYFRNITWIGNTKYTSNDLNTVLQIRKGDVYNQDVLTTNLEYNPNSIDVKSLYLDDGYLYFTILPVEVRVENDSIDLELRIREGKQAVINKVIFKGNTRTNDHVALREITTRPGQLFSRTDIIRSTQKLAQLKYFDPQKIEPVPVPNPNDGTVDIEYKVEETSSDQLELSGGWGNGRIIGTLGVSFNNFSARNMFHKDAWRPIPSGDGQKLSLRLQSYGSGYISYSASFTEPWLGGSKPTSLSGSYFHSLYTNGYTKANSLFGSFRTDGFTLMLGKRLQWPDDFFSLVQSGSMEIYRLHNYSSIFAFGNGYGTYNNLSYTISLSRSSIDAPIFTTSGSDITFSLKLTPPYSALSNKDFSKLSDAEKFRWIEYHEWSFNASFYKQLQGKLVFMFRTKSSFLGLYNRSIGITPFNRYFLGGDGLSGYNNLDGRKIIGFRGYQNETMTPDYYTNKNEGGTIYNKNTFELRYPLSLNPNSTIYMLAFLEAGNDWKNFKTFNPFDIKRSAGFGVRVFLPMFGVLGLDWGYGFDAIPGIPAANKGQFHFSMNQSID